VVPLILFVARRRAWSGVMTRLAGQITTAGNPTNKKRRAGY
jgi:hypothetical protein